MVSHIIAVYFGVGVGMIQILHSTHSKRIFGQKMVPVLEMIPGFSRRDPSQKKLISLHWLNISQLHRLPTGDSQTSIDDFVEKEPEEKDNNESPRLPKSLPPLQYNPEDLPRGIKIPFKHLGLQATNLYYCYFMSIFYGFCSYLVLRSLSLEGGAIGLNQILQLVGIFSSLLIFSALFVGASAAVTTLETNITFNTIILITIFNGVINYQIAVTLYQFVAALTISPLVFWLNFQEKKRKSLQHKTLRLLCLSSFRSFTPSFLQFY